MLFSSGILSSSTVLWIPRNLTFFWEQMICFIILWYCIERVHDEIDRSKISDIKSLINKHAQNLHYMIQYIFFTSEIYIFFLNLKIPKFVAQCETLLIIMHHIWIMDHRYIMNEISVCISLFLSYSVTEIILWEYDWALVYSLSCWYVHVRTCTKSG